MVEKQELSINEFIEMHTDKWYKGVEESDNTYWIIECVGYLTCMKDLYPNMAAECNKRIDKLCLRLDQILRERKEQLCGKS